MPQRAALPPFLVLALTLTLVLVLTLALAPSGMISKKGVLIFCPSTVVVVVPENPGKFGKKKPKIFEKSKKIRKFSRGPWEVPGVPREVHGKIFVERKKKWRTNNESVQIVCGLRDLGGGLGAEPPTRT